MMKIDPALQEKRPPGRPEGSGEQLPAVERIRRSRAKRAAAGAVRFDLTLDADHSDKLARLMQQWNCKTRKEAIEHALSIVCETIQPRAKG